MTTPLIDVRGLGMQFGGVHALRDVDFILTEGELRCLIGPNGAGKTTFFRVLTGIHKPSSGEVLIDGHDIRVLQTHQIVKLGVGIKTQIPSLFEGLSVHENVWLSARRYHRPIEARDIADGVLEQLHLTAFASREVGMLSHGQRQRIELAVVIAAKPKLVLLDEPAAGMTGREREETAELIKRVNESCAVVVVEHDMEFIRMIAKTITVFNRGTILAEGGADTVLNDQRVKDVYLGKQKDGVTL